MIEKELRQKRKTKWVQQIIATAWCVEDGVGEAWPMSRYFRVASQPCYFKHLQVINFRINLL